jgi:nitrogen fixation NifU-like protein
MATNDPKYELYQQVILDHNKNPRNFKKLTDFTHMAEGYNPLCGDHLTVFLKVKDDMIEELSFIGDGCAISKASASMMTTNLKGKKVGEANQMFEEFHELIKGNLDPEKDKNHLGRLSIFSSVWHFPARVKCASLCWHTMHGALDKKQSISTE